MSSVCPRVHQGKGKKINVGKPPPKQHRLLLWEAVQHVDLASMSGRSISVTERDRNKASERRCRSEPFPNYLFSPAGSQQRRFLLILAQYDVAGAEKTGVGVFQRGRVCGIDGVGGWHVLYTLREGLVILSLNKSGLPVAPRQRVRP